MDNIHLRTQKKESLIEFCRKQNYRLLILKGIVGRPFEENEYKYFLVNRFEIPTAQNYFFSFYAVEITDLVAGQLDVISDEKFHRALLTKTVSEDRSKFFNYSYSYSTHIFEMVNYGT